MRQFDRSSPVPILEVFTCAAVLLCAACIPDQTSPRVATHILFIRQPPVTANALDTLGTLEVAFLDADNSIVTATKGSIEIGLASADSSVRLLGHTRVAAAHGVAAFPNLRIDKAGADYRLVARTTGLDSVLSAPFRIRPGFAGALVFLASVNGTVAGVPLDTVRVAVLDGAGHLDTASSAAVTIRLPLDSISGSTTRTVVSGIATFTDLLIYKARRDHALIATAPAMFADTSNVFAVDMATVTELRFYDQPLRDGPAWSLPGMPLPNGTVRAGVPFHVQAELADQYGNWVPVDCMRECFSRLGPIVPATISLGENPGGATLTTVDSQTQLPEHGYDWAWGVVISKVGVGYTLVVTAPPYRPDTTRPFTVVP